MTVAPQGSRTTTQRIAPRVTLQNKHARLRPVACPCIAALSARAGTQIWSGPRLAATAQATPVARRALVGPPRRAHALPLPRPHRAHGARSAALVGAPAPRTRRPRRPVSVARSPRT
ncbi:hypothetical protein ZWY2020_012810 [Hordeum vulgare]|nr:hypothetical protein ZWY2020_012810 [Hordeum vulgare]